MTQHWLQVIKDTWHLEGQLTRMNGEYDENFLLQSDDDYVFKVMRPGCEASFVDMQCQAIQRIKKLAPEVPVPVLIATHSGDNHALVTDENGSKRIVWLLEKLEGYVYAEFFPKTPDLATQLGRILGHIDNALADFQHAGLQRELKWNLLEADWINDHLPVIEETQRKALIASIISGYLDIKPTLEQLPRSAIHNDVNDYNILSLGSLTGKPRITGVFDFGDMCMAPRVCELAIAAAYLVLDHEEPTEMLTSLVAAYYQEFALTAEELDLIWPLTKMRLAVSLVNSTMMAKENPDDAYVVISQQPAWRFLENHKINEKQIGSRLRVACGLPVTNQAPQIMQWLDENRGSFAPVIGQDLTEVPMGSLAVEDSTTPANPFNMVSEEAVTTGKQYGVNGPTWIGYYNEPRLLYTEPAFRLGPWKASDRRTVHLGVDLFAAAGTEIQAPLDGIVEFAGYRSSNLDYGGLIMLSHETTNGDRFYTLFGHLSKASAESLTPGQVIKKGEVFAAMGETHENGGWNPHVHFQLALSIDGMEEDWPGAASPDDLDFWHALCPNPAALLNLADEKTGFRPVDKTATLEARQQHFAPNLKLSYRSPVMLLRGWKHHLFDEWGRPYLDAYNNVPHVGHAHPRIQAVAADQLKRLNSNTRYLHPAQTAFAEKILSKLPDQFEVCYFDNSGSEANELALRLARAFTGGKDMITPDHGYHGNTTGAIDISAYKFNAPGGVGQPDWVQLVEVADDYRGSFRRDDPDRAQKYADLVRDAIQRIEKRGGKLAGFIAETFPSVGGQIIPPIGYLQQVYQHIRNAGGVCIADEVQTGLGRLGDYYFGFEQQEVLPDIVVLGKPLGNGHPLGAVITTREIAESFAKGPEFFTTFGGSTLSCRIGKEVLDIVDDEGLMENARVMGNQLLDGLRQLQEQYDTVGDVRGYGLFIGVELVNDPGSREPHSELASYIKERLRQHRILIGTEGPADNILKIRPPLTIDREGVEMLLVTLRSILNESTFCVPR